MYTNKPITAELLSGRIALEFEKDKNLMNHAKLIQKVIQQRDAANLEIFKEQVLQELRNHKVPQALKKEIKNIVLHSPDLKFLTDNELKDYKIKASLCNV
tara:strand:+ start:586 stop:885 length:300 start_codon:yes stop_codon:yes gene_type:complete